MIPGAHLPMGSAANISPKSGWRGLAKLAGDQPGFKPLSEAERDASRNALLKAKRRDRSVWIFGYGSLMWNPAVHVAERRFARVHGFHRSFCLWTPLGRWIRRTIRGWCLVLNRAAPVTVSRLRLAPDKVDSETQILWRREMFAGGLQAAVD